MRLFQIAGTVENTPVEVRRYGDRTWAVWFNGDLLCVTVYLRGANAVKLLIERLQAELRLARGGQADLPAAVEHGLGVHTDRQA